MCLIMFGAVEEILKNSRWLHNAFSRNSNAIGLTDGVNRVVPKTVKELEGVLLEYSSSDPTKQLAIHFRFSTHGIDCDANTHPFPLKNGGFLMHNGVLHIDDIQVIIQFFQSDYPVQKLTSEWKKGKKSDTALLVEVLNTIEPKYWKETLECLTDSRFLLWSDGEVHLLNGFTEKKGIMLSNEYSIAEPFSYHTKKWYNSYYSKRLTSPDTVNSVAIEWEDEDEDAYYVDYDMCDFCQGEVEEDWYYCAWCGSEIFADSPPDKFNNSTSVKSLLK